MGLFREASIVCTGSGLDLYSKYQRERCDQKPSEDDHTEKRPELPILKDFLTQKRLDRQVRDRDRALYTALWHKRHRKEKEKHIEIVGTSGFEAGMVKKSRRFDDGDISSSSSSSEDDDEEEEDEEDEVEGNRAVCNGLTLGDILIDRSRPVQARSEYKLPKLNVIEIRRDKNGDVSTSAGNVAALNMNQRMNQMKAQKELTSVQMYSQRLVKLRMTQNHRRQATLPWFGSTMVVPQGLGYYRVRCPTFHNLSPRDIVVPMEQEFLSLGSSSTPTVPYSTADILYGSEVNGRNPDESRNGSIGEGERNGVTRQKSRELELHPNNRRPSSKSASRKSLSIDTAGTFHSEKEETMKSASSSTLPPTKPGNHFRPNGIRSNLLKGESIYSSKSNGAASSNGRDQDDLVAMGTLWNPNTGQQQTSTSVLPSPQQHQQQQLQQQQQQSTPSISSRNNSISNNTNTNSYPSKVVQSTSSVQSSMSSSNNTMAPQRKYASNNVRPIMVQNNNVSGKKNNLKEQEDPKYTDPMLGAPASFQQRIIELGALEGDTVRWERTKRLKKKKQDRDS